MVICVTARASHISAIWLTRLGFAQEPPTMNSKKSDRRGFLKRSAALADLAAGALPFANGIALAGVTPGLIDSGEPTTEQGVTPDEPTIEDLAHGGRSG